MSRFFYSLVIIIVGLLFIGKLISLQLFYEIDSRKDDYKSTYGVQPVSKACVHVGRVTGAEVGVLKREISYHGDTLNTAAPIEGRCNDLQSDLLISGSLAEAM